MAQFTDGSVDILSRDDGRILSQAAAGSVGGMADAGSTVVVSLNGVTYNTVSDATGNWSASVPAADPQALPQCGNTLQVTVDWQAYDVYHNPALASTNTPGDVLIQHALQVHVA